MLEKKTQDNGMVRVTFRVSEHIWADCIALVGEFNNWDTHSHRLRQTGSDGEWQISLELQTGCSYRFHYLVDGNEWMDDDRADSSEPNIDGGFDSVVCT
jgi:1,4-alpha-glucan branching enzyme